MQIFTALTAMGYEWVIRVDPDSNFPSVIPYNVIHAMEEKKTEYGFRAMSHESKRMSRGLAEAAKYWLVSEDQTATFLLEMCKPRSMQGLSSAGWSYDIFYNNFFVTRIGFWMQPHIQGWLRHLERLNGYHKFRWGDAPVHTLTLGMFADKATVMEFGF